MSDDEMQIDPKVARLVDVLNNLPGVSTNSSCGGHAETTNVSQCPENEWYVDFELVPHQMAWASLERIAMACGEFFSDDGLVELKVWHDGCVRFDLRGVDVTADEFADALEFGCDESDDDV